MAVSQSQCEDYLFAEVNYVRNPRQNGEEPLTFVTEAEELSTMVTKQSPDRSF